MSGDNEIMSGPRCQESGNAYLNNSVAFVDL